MHTVPDTDASINAPEAGFSLVEVLAALAIVATALLPLFQMQLAVSEANQRGVRSAATSTAIRDLSSFFSTLNPGSQPSGRLNLNGAVAEWTSTELRTYSRPSHLRQTSLNVSLFEVSVVLTTVDGHVLFEDKLNIVGWRI